MLQKPGQQVEQARQEAVFWRRRGFCARETMESRVACFSGVEVVGEARAGRERERKTRIGVMMERILAGWCRSSEREEEMVR
jgi:hypothetical protein